MWLKIIVCCLGGLELPEDEEEKKKPRLTRRSLVDFARYLVPD